MFCSLFSSSLAGFFGVVSGLIVLLFIILEDQPLVLFDTQVTDGQKLALVISVGGIIIMTTDAYIHTISVVSLFMILALFHASLKTPASSFPPLPPMFSPQSHLIGISREGSLSSKSESAVTGIVDPLALFNSTKNKLSSFSAEKVAWIQGTNFSELVSKGANFSEFVSKGANFSELVSKGANFSEFVSKGIKDS